MSANLPILLMTYDNSFTPIISTFFADNIWLALISLMVVAIMPLIPLHDLILTRVNRRGFIMIAISLTCWALFILGALLQQSENADEIAVIATGAGLIVSFLYSQWLLYF
ncbi:MAG: hypothetical protein Q4F60_03310 [Candidatus Saccharibacteria bacterium]|nr:hypothetical protein [Candidatus Saccharibacteria bacterium]